MKPMLAAAIGPKFNRYPCYVQPKLNGVRALYQAGTWQSRDEKVWRPEVLLHLTSELSCLGLDNLILDGELYKYGWRLQRINGAVAINRSQPREDTGEICFHVFDTVAPERKFSDRFLDIYNHILNAQLPHIIPVPTTLAHSATEMEQSFHLYTSLGYEGIMLRPDGKYEFGEHLSPRTGNLTRYNSKFLWKHKQWEDDEFLCVGVTQGEGKAAIGVGALTCKVVRKMDINSPISSVETAFGVGTGLTDQDRIEFMQNPPIGKLVRVRYLQLTEDGIPFNPSFIAVL